MITIDNKPGSGGSRKLNLLVLSGGTAVIPFNGETIPGVARVTKSQYEKQGKWSHTRWDVELAEGVVHHVMWTDWSSDQYVPAHTWERAIADMQSAIRARSRVDVTAEAVETFIRACLSRTAQRLDTEAAKADLPAAGVAEELVEAQRLAAEAQREESAVRALVAAEIARREAQEAQVAEAAKVRQEAAAAKARAAKARDALKQAGSMSLADLKALLG